LARPVSHLPTKVVALFLEWELDWELLKLEWELVKLDWEVVWELDLLVILDLDLAWDLLVRLDLDLAWDLDKNLVVLHLLQVMHTYPTCVQPFGKM